MNSNAPITPSVEEVTIGSNTIRFETGKYAKQAGGSVVVSSGESSVLVTAVVGGPARFDFLPLTVNYEDRFGSFGAIPGGFLKREGASNERETLICRVIDRPIRPMFPKNFRRELQCIATVLSYDPDHDTDVLALCGASAAFTLSEAPMSEAIAGVRICKVDGEWHFNPSNDLKLQATVDLMIAGTRSNITMVEGGGDEASEDEILDALELAQVEIARVVDAIEALAAKAGKPMMEVEPEPEPVSDIVAAMEAGEADLAKALAIDGKHERGAALKEARNALIAKLVDGEEDEEVVAARTADAKTVWEKMIRRSMRATVIKEGKRLDGRATDEIRSVWCEVGLAPRAHGSAVFTRGETQTFVTLAMGTDKRDAQMLDYPGGKIDRKFMLTYNFAPFCTGEARMLRGPKRREIGHGALARRGLEPMLPSQEEFPYIMRLTADTLESNGSSSMATVCGGTLAMLDAGVPLKRPVAGIAMGLIKEGDDYAVLSDILGDEDHLGDMDFKVTGTSEGITAFQMDTKISGVSREVMGKALRQAREGRIHILGEMTKTIDGPREEMSQYAPRITSLQINAEKIRDIIGPGGKVIRSIQETCDVKVNVDDSGRVEVASNNQENTDKAMAMIREITQEAELGALYLGVVKRIVDFGAFVEIFPGTDGLVHISHLANERTDDVRDVLSEGDEVLVRVIDIDRSGKIRLSRKEALDSVGAFGG